MAGAVLLDDCYERQGEGFVDLLRACSDDRKLAALAERMIKDPRPWVRAQILAYLDTPWDRPGHHPLVKRLFKHAERTGDVEAMARCLVACDRAVRRRLVRRTQWDWQTRTASEREELVLQRAGLLALHPARHPQAKPARGHAWAKTAPLFSLATRLHLRRRAWRFFRRLGFQHGERYVTAIIPALRRYTDADLAAGQDLLESWGLVHALFAKSPALDIKGTWIGIADGRTLADLAPAPAFAPRWADAAAFPWLLELASEAASKLVRTWAQDLLAAQHAAALAALPLSSLRTLIDSTWEDVRLLGLRLFAAHGDLPGLSVAAWTGLLGVGDAAALAQIVEAMQQHVRGSRLTHAETVALACHRAVPVVRLALGWLGEKRWDAAEERAALLGLRSAACAALAEELGRFALGHLATATTCTADHVLLCLDHRLPGMRAAAMAWIEANDHVRADPVLWARAAESPDDVVRAWLVRCLDRFAAEARLAGDQRRLLWTTVLLGVHRGGREKQAAIRQLTAAIVAEPDQAPALLPLLAAALRSLRLPERRAACAALVGVLVRRGDLREAITALVPELDCSLVASGAA